MNKTKEYDIRDLSLAEQGFRNISFAEMQMKALMEIKRDFEKRKPLKGLRISMALHVTKETAVLVKTLVAGGAEVFIASCNPLSTQDDVAAALAKSGINVFAWKGETKEEYYKNIERVLSLKPNFTIDDGCDLVSAIHSKHRNLIPNIIAGCEETTTGVLRLKSMEREKKLRYPIIAVNESKTKNLMDNVYGTGQSAIDGIIRCSNILFAGKNVVVCGYGNCGKGVSLRAKGLGSNVIVTEVDPFKALQAHMDGFRVMRLREAAKIGDIFITVTGNKKVINYEDIVLMKDGAILANAGHFDVEIDVKTLEKKALSKKRIRPLFDEYVINIKNKKKRIYLCGEGRLVNLACAEGHPSSIMDLSFCNQALAVEYAYENFKNGKRLEVKVHTLPEEIDKKIAEIYLKANGIRIDKLTKEQINYLKSWKEGT
ncbi:MAG: adenosylhomocysteinase [Candidatus Woesearchaeota archaeon]